jgi:hypothetical protein
MRKVLVVAILVLVGIIWSAPTAWAINLSSVLKKEFVINRWSGEMLVVKIEVVTPLGDANTVKEFSTFKKLLDLHKQAVRTFQEQGWKEYLAKEITADIYAGSVVIIVEKRINLKFKKRLIIKTFLLPCGTNPLWNMVKYHGGGLTCYFQKITKRVDRCIRENYKIP